MFVTLEVPLWWDIGSWNLWDVFWSNDQLIDRRRNRALAANPVFARRIQNRSAGRLVRVERLVGHFLLIWSSLNWLINSPLNANFLRYIVQGLSWGIFNSTWKKIDSIKSIFYCPQIIRMTNALTAIVSYPKSPYGNPLDSVKNNTAFFSEGYDDSN